MPSLGPTEIILIILALLLLFGGRKIPELMRGLGSGIKEFKKASTVDSDDDQPREKSRIEGSHTGNNTGTHSQQSARADA